MKLNLILLILSIGLLSCREKKYDKNVNGQTLREQIEAMQALNNGDLSTQLANRPPEFREGLARQILESLDETQLEKLTSGPRFKELMKKKAEASQEAMKKTLEDLNHKQTETFDAIDIQVKREVGVNRNRRMSWVDPFIRYHIDSGRKNISCDDLASTSSYWDDVLGLQQNENALLGSSYELFEQSLKSCLLFYRVKESMEKCKDVHLEELTHLCQMGEAEAN